MKLPTLAMSLALASLIPSLAAAQTATASAAADLSKDTQAQASYTIGFNIGSQMRNDAITVDPEIMARGLKDALAGAKPQLTSDQMHAAMTALQTGIAAHRQQLAAKLSESNKTEGAAFLKANAAKPGVLTTPSGLQYEILVKGTGAKPKATDIVVCNYKGTLVNGTEFDASEKHGGPASLPVNGVIKGWGEALQMMPVGSKWRLVVPADLAYGAQGAGGEIGPNAVLIFEIELVSIKAS